MKRIFFVVFLSVVSLSGGGLFSSAQAGIYDYHGHWLTIQTPHFAIHFVADNEPIARRVAELVEETHKILTDKFKRYPVGKTEVVLLDTFDSSNGFATVVPYNMLILRLVAPSPENNLGDYDNWLRELIIHEYTHILHISDTEYPAKIVKFFVGKLMAPNGTTPGWIREGLAAYFETAETERGRGRSSFTDMLLRTDILKGRFLKLDQMAGSQFDWPSWLAQYLYGVGFMKFLAERYGEEKLIEYSHSYGATLRFYALNSHAKKVFRKDRDPQLVASRCENDNWADKGTWQVRETYPEFCGPQGKSFHDLWEEWRQSLEAKYQGQKGVVEQAGLKEGDPKVEGLRRESIKLPTYSPDGHSLAYIVESVDHPMRLVLRDEESGKERVLIKKREISQLSFSPDGKQLVFSAMAPKGRYRSYWDLFSIDLDTGKVKQLTRGKRARDPDFSPDGRRLVFVQQLTGHSQLGFYDFEKNKIESAGEVVGEDQTVPDELNHPRWSPDGKWIAVSRHYRGQRDLWLIDPNTLGKKRLTDDAAMEDRPLWNRSGKSLFYTSDRTGISNIFRYDLQGGATSQVSNVLTGAFAPSLKGDGTLVYQYYTGKGYEGRGLEVAGGPVVDVVLKPKKGKKGKRAKAVARAEEVIGLEERGDQVPAGKLPEGKLPEVAVDTTAPAKHYRALRQLLLPRFVYPNGAFVDSAVFLSGTIGSFDPLQWHSWMANVNYRSDNNYFGYGGSYTYQRFVPVFFAGYNNFTVNFGDLYGVGIDYFEKRQRGTGGVAFPLFKGKAQLSYFFEDRSSHSGIPATAITFPTTGNYAGFHAQYDFGIKEKYGASISVEKGIGLALNADVTDSFFGSSGGQEQQLFYGDLRGYVPLGHHQVLALRGAGGISFGDTLTQGNYSLGGSLGESPFVQTSTRLFTLRGVPLGSFSRDDAWVFSAEYRFPLFRAERGVGTLPFFLNSAHFALFTDVGDAFNRNQTNSKFRPMLSMGAELRGDFVIGYGIPITGRLGYGIVLTNRGRLAGLTDPFISTAANRGVVVFDIGTSF